MLNEYNKLPQFPKKRDQLTKKKELEEKLEIQTKEVAKLKQELRELNAISRDF